MHSTLLLLLNDWADSFSWLFWSLSTTLKKQDTVQLAPSHTTVLDYAVAVLAVTVLTMNSWKWTYIALNNG